MSDLKLKVYKANKDALVYVEGGTNFQNFLIIKSGKARIIRDIEISDNPNENILHDGDYFGVVSCMSKRPRLETVKTLEESYLISVEYDQFIELIKTNKSVAQKILKLYSQKLRYFDEAIARLSLKQAISNDPENIFNIGSYYYTIKEFKQANYAFNQFIKLCPESQNVQIAQQYQQEMAPALEGIVEFEQITPLIRQYSDKSILFCENEPGDDVFVIQEGKIKITKVVGDQEILLAVLNPGDIVGEMALIENKLRSANAIAFGTTKVLAINKRNFEVMVENQPQMTLRIIQLLSERIWVAYRQLENLAIPDEYGRILDLLLIQIQKKRLPIEDRKSHEFEFSTEDLINMAGFPKGRGQMYLNKLLEDSNFKMEGGKIVVLDTQTLFNQVEVYRKKINKD
jgi:CRP/FNR family transcriptional regulator